MVGAIAAMSSVLSEMESLASAASGPSASAGMVAPGLEIAPMGGASFSQMLHAAVGQLDDTVASASGAAQSFAAGNHDIPLSDVMISMEQANIAMQLAANVRDKVTAAYTNVMNMPV
ncbi:MAG: flagellar hook-basal body complex protein FliE [Alphaproteobacteria bacterium]|nr:flagellar hook-basal body complex protein FliE [Alphaproteobacteria bacterium]